MDNVSQNATRILIVRLSAIGDVLHTLPALEVLRKHFPEAHIAWLVEDRGEDLLVDHPELDEVFVYKRKEWQKALVNPLRLPDAIVKVGAFVRSLRRKPFDVVLDFQGNFKSGVIGWIARARSRIGFAKGFCREFNHAFSRIRIRPSGSRIHRIEKNLSLIRPLVGEAKYSGAKIVVNKEDVAYIEDFLQSHPDLASRYGHKKRVLLHPGTSEFGAYKRWPAVSYARLALKLTDEAGVSAIVSWGPGEKELAEKVSHLSNGKAVVACQTRNIRELAALIAACDVFVGSDSAPLHIASLLNVPVVALFGPKDPRVYGPYGGRSIIIEKELSCRPCSRRTCMDPQCMKMITPDEVYEAVLHTLILNNAKVIAVVGLSDKPARDSYRVASYLKEQGYRIIPVNPGVQEVLGEKSYATLHDVPEKVDVVDIFRKPESVPEVVDAAIEICAGVVWMQEGISHRAAAEKARAAGLKVVMDRCIMKEHRRVFGQGIRAQ